MGSRLHYLAATLHTMGLTVMDRARAKVGTDRERGSVTMEQVLWAVAVIAIVAIVVTAIRNYVTTQAGKIN